MLIYRLTTSHCSLLEIYEIPKRVSHHIGKLVLPKCDRGMDFIGLILTNDFLKLSALKIKDFGKLFVDKNNKLLMVLVYHPIDWLSIIMLLKDETDPYFSSYGDDDYKKPHGYTNLCLALRKICQSLTPLDVLFNGRYDTKNPQLISMLTICKNLTFMRYRAQNTSGIYPADNSTQSMRFPTPNALIKLVLDVPNFPRERAGLESILKSCPLLR